MATGFEKVIIWLRAIHLGRNPVRGGRPPKDKIVNDNIVVKEFRGEAHI